MSDLNVGNLDRLLRVAVGIAMLGLAAGGVIGAWGWLGVVPLVTGLSARCPLYALAGVRTTGR